MDFATLIGLIGGIGVILFGIFSGGQLDAFINIPSVIVTLGGGLMSSIISVSMDVFVKGMKAVPVVLRRQAESPEGVIRTLVELSQKARREGLLSLETADTVVNDPFLKKSLELVVDGVEVEVMKDSMRLELENMAIRHNRVISMYKTMATMFPAWGMIGTLLGLINLLRGLDDPAQIGSSMAIALVTTFYGAILANFICTPIANKLTAYSEMEIHLKEMVVEGVICIHEGINPRIMENKLKTFLSPEQRFNYERLAITTTEPDRTV